MADKDKPSGLSEQEYEQIAQNTMNMIGGALRATFELHANLLLPERAEAMEDDMTPFIAGAIAALVGWLIDEQHPERDAELIETVAGIFSHEVAEARFDLIAGKANAVGTGNA